MQITSGSPRGNLKTSTTSSWCRSILKHIGSWKNHIAKALVPLLQVWLYASKKAESFEKRYSELCEILTLQTYRAPSQILRQFKPSLDELTHHEYLEKWRIEKTTDRKGYKVIFFHGQKF